MMSWAVRRPVPGQHAVDRVDLAALPCATGTTARLALLGDLVDRRGDDRPVDRPADRVGLGLKAAGPTGTPSATGGSRPSRRGSRRPSTAPSWKYSTAPSSSLSGRDCLDEGVDGLGVARGQRPRDVGRVADADDRDARDGDAPGVVPGAGELDLHQQHRVVAELRLAHQQGAAVGGLVGASDDLERPTRQRRGPFLQRGAAIAAGLAGSTADGAAVDGRGVRPAHRALLLVVGAGPDIEVVGQRDRVVGQRLERRRPLLRGLAASAGKCPPTAGRWSSPCHRPPARRGRGTAARPCVATELGLQRLERPHPLELALALRGDEAGHEHTDGQDVLGREFARARRRRTAVLGGQQRRPDRRGHERDPVVDAGDVAVDGDLGVRVRGLVDRPCTRPRE